MKSKSFEFWDASAIKRLGKFRPLTNWEKGIIGTERLTKHQKLGCKNLGKIKKRYPKHGYRVRSCQSCKHTITDHTVTFNRVSMGKAFCSMPDCGCRVFNLNKNPATTLL